MIFLSFSLQPYGVEAAESLAYASQTAFAGQTSDSWRLREWPFADTQAAVQAAFALCLQTVDGHIPCAWSVLENEHVIGVIAVTHMDDACQTGLLGTYITPHKRGQGIQKIAKELLFARLPKPIETLFCVIVTANRSYLQAIRKIPYATLVDPADYNRLPPAVLVEVWRARTPVAVYQLPIKNACRTENFPFCPE